ncbi:hypothetical protein K3148_11675 [Qipengyuania aurantiaca]|uniref:O-antigen ligase domain-containing protein n=1 Tax=Qipengyuania aurantiaca TaxID=2867233 RepID=A0ABX8ZL40_9SPHN|nr:hypothetical protein [Qipengyuania aurantiaca]QZD89461.1 hypothetical protein K3148_11675 [Qipengyuania aurantiaca]
MKVSTSLPLALAMAVPRTAFSYAGYVAAPLFMINWLSSRTYAKASFLFSILAISAIVNLSLGLSFSITAWALELLLLFPFMAAALGFLAVRYLNGRKFIRILNTLVFVTSIFSLVQQGFPFRLPYIHYLPDFWNGGFGNGGAKIVTIIGFFGIVEALTRNRTLRIVKNYSLIIALANFLVPNFILGMLAGFAALVIFVRKNRALLFAGAALALVLVPYVQYRIEQKNDAFSEAYGSSPKVYAFAAVGQLYLNEPHAIIVGTGLGQFTSQPAIWSSPINRYISSHDTPQLPGMFSAEVHDEYIAPAMLRFRTQKWAVLSSANKPYSGLSQALAELGVPLTFLLFYCLYRLFWRGGTGEFGKAVFLFAVFVNLLDPQIDSPWFGVMMIASLEVIRRTRAKEVLDLRPQGFDAGKRAPLTDRMSPNRYTATQMR